MYVYVNPLVCDPALPSGLSGIRIVKEKKGVTLNLILSVFDNQSRASIASEMDARLCTIRNFMKNGRIL